MTYKCVVIHPKSQGYIHSSHLMSISAIYQIIYNLYNQLRLKVLVVIFFTQLYLVTPNTTLVVD